MNYGSTAYGAAALGGSAASQWYTFLPYQVYAQGSHEAEAEISISDEWFSLFLQKSSENTDVLIEVYSRHNTGETPQSQGSFGGLYAQYVVGAAAFIKVIAVINDVGGELLTVRGRAGD